MEYFNIKRSLFIVPSEKCNAEFEKIDKFMCFLENPGVGKIIENVKHRDNNLMLLLEILKINVFLI